MQQQQGWWLYVAWRPAGTELWSDGWLLCCGGQVQAILPCSIHATTRSFHNPTATNHMQTRLCMWSASGQVRASCTTVMHRLIHWLPINCNQVHLNWPYPSPLCQIRLGWLTKLNISLGLCPFSPQCVRSMPCHCLTGQILPGLHLR